MVTSSAIALPPIQVSGKTSTEIRSNQPSDGSDTLAISKTLEVGATSYIWEPWFGTWQARVAGTRADTDAEESTEAEILTGDVNVNLFHRSHFPFSAYLSLQDSRVDISNLSQAASDVQALRMGVSQQYQDRSRGIFYFGSLDHDEQRQVVTGNETTQDRLLFTVDRDGDTHDLGAVVTMTRSESSPAASQVTSGQGTFYHNYRPRPGLNLTTNGSLSSVEADNPFQDTASRVYALASQAEWRPEGQPLRVRAEASGAREETDTRDLAAGTITEFTDTLRTRLSGRYELSDETSLFGELGVDRRTTSTASQLSTLQSISVTHASRPIPLREFSYTYAAGGGLANRTDSEGGDIRSASFNLGHAVTRGWVSGDQNPVSVVFSAGQDGRFSQQTDESRGRTQITHRATLTASQAGASGTAYGQLTGFDVRNYGETEGSTSSFIASATLNRALTRYRSIDFVGSYNFVRSESEGIAQNRDNLSGEVLFRDARLFNLNRLTLDSRVRAEMANLVATEVEETTTELEWDTRLNYQIGLVEVNSRAVLTFNGEDNNILLLLGITRRF